MANSASAMATACDRRRHKRFEILSHGLRLVKDSGSQEDYEPCMLVNVSYSGVPFRASRELQEGTIHRFFIELPWPIGFAALVKARICWVRRSDPQGYDLGAEFVESSKGWLGPED